MCVGGGGRVTCCNAAAFAASNNELDEKMCSSSRGAHVVRLHDGCKTSAPIPSRPTCAAWIAASLQNIPQWGAAEAPSWRIVSAPRPRDVNNNSQFPNTLTYQTQALVFLKRVRTKKEEKLCPTFWVSYHIFPQEASFLHFITTLAVSSSRRQPLIQNIAHFHTIFADWLSELKFKPTISVGISRTNVELIVSIGSIPSPMTHCCLTRSCFGFFSSSTKRKPFLLIFNT